MWVIWLLFLDGFMLFLFMYINVNCLRIRVGKLYEIDVRTKWKFRAIVLFKKENDLKIWSKLIIICLNAKNALKSISKIKSIRITRAKCIFNELTIHMLTAFRKKNQIKIYREKKKSFCTTILIRSDWDVKYICLSFINRLAFMILSKTLIFLNSKCSFHNSKKKTIKNLIENKKKNENKK